MDRRDFVTLGGLAAALAATESAKAASAAPGLAGKTVIDFGVVPDSWGDQSAALQTAINELAAAGQPIAIPAGRYRAAKLQLPSKACVLGVPGLTVLMAPQGSPAFESLNAQEVSIRGVSFSGAAIAARECRNLTISECTVSSSPGDGIVCSGTGLLVAGNRVHACAGAAIWVEGGGIVTNNLVSGPGQFGLRLGGPERLGMLTVTGNRIEGTATGIAASSSENGYAMIAMNMILGAKKGGIRALIGSELSARELAQGGSEAFRNLAIVLNVSM